MEKRVLVVCILVSFLALLSIILAFAAEPNRVKAENIRISNGECKYSQRPAFGLGIVSALLLLAFQILISSFAGCICCNKTKPSGAKFCIGVVCYVVSWVTFVLAFILLLAGAAVSSSHTQEIRSDNTCFVAKSGVFIGAAVLVFLTAGLGIVYYLLASLVAPSVVSVYNQGIAMAQPQMNAPPVFVHEDTYRRQQNP